MIFLRSNAAIRSTQPISKSMSRSTPLVTFPFFNLPENRARSAFLSTSTLLLRATTPSSSKPAAGTHECTLPGRSIVKKLPRPDPPTGPRTKSGKRLTHSGWQSMETDERRPYVRTRCRNNDNEGRRAPNLPHPSRFAAARTCGATAQRIAAFVILRQSGRIFMELFAGKDRKCGHAILFPAASAWPP